MVADSGFGSAAVSASAFWNSPQGYRVAVGCTTCPCATCGASEKCCPAPTGHTYAICVQGTPCPALI
ncbi:MAG: hypothetical protein JNL79_09805 [Myxococcales bacterium]|nr:hypothetical protein [Myxococcales bacterium]